MMNRVRAIVLAGAMTAIALAVLGPAAIAQSTRATLAGQVMDGTGAVLPEVQVVVTNTETGLQRSSSTDSKGYFSLPELNPGTYQLTLTHTGFDSLVRNGITLQVGQIANLNFEMRVGSVEEQVTVTAEAPLVNTTTSSVGGVVDSKQIEELPLNGRDFGQLPLIQVGVYAERNTSNISSMGYGARISMGGSRVDATAWLLDGTNIRGTGFLALPGSAAGLMLGVEAVREFQVLTSNYSAEFGGSSGGVINMVTKSGTNSLHGSLFEYLRNKSLDARNFFDGSQKPGFKRNQFGGALGGPVRKDKTFFFGNYEGLRQPLTTTKVSFVPDAASRTGIISPATRPYLDLYPLPNEATATAGTGRLFFPGDSTANEDYFVLRGDHHISDKQSIFGRFTFDQGGVKQPDQTPVTQVVVAAHSRFATVQHDYIYSPQFLITSRVAYNRSLLNSDNATLVDYPKSLELFFPGALPSITPVAGISVVGPAFSSIFHRVSNHYVFQEALQYIRGSHTLKFGFEMTQAGYNKSGEATGTNGSYQWSTLQNFLADATLQSFSAPAAGNDLFRSFKQYFYGFYIQDDWRMRSDFTWNFGLRYEPYTTPSEKHDRITMLKDWVHDKAFDTSIGLFRNPSKKDFMPRVGFAWNPGGDGRTAVRAGIGLFFANIVGNAYNIAGQKNPPFSAYVNSPLGSRRLSTSVADVSEVSKGLLSPVLTPDTSLEIIQWNIDPSYEVKFNFSLERQLPGNVAVTVGYLGNRGVHLWRLLGGNDIPPTRDANGRLFIAPGTPRANPNAGTGTLRNSDSQSFYNGLLLSVKKNLSRGYQFQGSYTWSKNIDDGTTGGSRADYNEATTSQAYVPKVDRGLSALDVRHNLVISGIYAIPSLVNGGVGEYLLGGWQLSQIFTASSGTPFTVLTAGRNAPDGSRNAGAQHPDLLAGRPGDSITSGQTAGCSFVNGAPGPYNAAANPNFSVRPGQALGTELLYYDPCAYVVPPNLYFGNSGRNTLLGPGLLNFDLSLMKEFPLRWHEGMKLEFHAGAFNLFNRANFGLPGKTVLNPANGQIVAGAGVVTTTVTNSRQLQFALKLQF